MPQEYEISRSQAIEQVTAAMTGPMSIAEFYERVLELWPSTAKTAKTSIRTTMRYEALGKTLLFLDKKTLIPTRLAMQDVTFRMPVDDELVETGLLPLNPTFSGVLLPSFFHPDQIDINFVDAAGQPLTAPLITQSFTAESTFGLQDAERPVFDLSDWCSRQGLKPGDSVLLTVDDWDRQRFRLTHEPAEISQTRRDAIEQRNQELCDRMFEILESARDDSLQQSKVVLTAHARLANPTGYPGDHWLIALNQDGRMISNGSDIRYADDPHSYYYYDPFSDEEDEDYEEDDEPLAELSETEAQAVYRFKAALKYRPGLWRRIEIQGGQTLADLNSVLVRAFNHDWDHMAGFWKRVRRGKSKRYRDLDLGSINPLGEGEAADIWIAELELEPGQELKYVFDFGDWIEHKVTLEAIDKPDESAEYPREVARNKPRYRYCQHCKKAGKKTVATWICIECSDEAQKDVVVCEACRQEHHEEHFADELVY